MQLGNLHQRFDTGVESPNRFPMLFKLVVGNISDAQLGYSRENGSLELLCNHIAAIVGGDQKQGAGGAYLRTQCKV